jgi:hypothetical protein
MTGQELAEQGIERAGSGQPVATLVSWQDRARIALIWLCDADSSFSAEDLRNAMKDDPPPTPNCLGAVFHSAAHDGLIVPDGVDLAKRPERHASLIRLWRRA